MFSSLLRHVVVVLLTLTLGTAMAGPLAHYRIELTVTQVNEQSSGWTCDDPSSLNPFGCVGLGDVYVGRFAVDQDILGTEGINATAQIFDFRLLFGSEGLYSTGADNQILSGFRNASGFAAAPGFLIENHQVVDLVGGIYGSGDVPFVDMYGYAGVGRNAFSAFDGRYQVTGSLAVFRAPLPGTIALVLLAGCLAAVVVPRRRHSPSRC